MSDIKETKKKDGTIVYKKRVYLGTDSLAGVGRYTTISASKNLILRILNVRKSMSLKQMGKQHFGK